MIWHKLRGHTIRSLRRHVNTSRAGVESGRIDDLRICSCGETLADGNSKVYYKEGLYRKFYERERLDGES